MSSMIAYQKGALARKNNVVVGDNPFDETVEDHWAWIRGWLDGVTV